MTPAEFTAIRDALGLPRSELAAILGIEDPNTITRWSTGKRSVPGPVATLMRIFVDVPEVLREAMRINGISS